MTDAAPLKLLADHAGAVGEGDLDVEPLPRRGPRDVVVEIGASGVCHSDLHVIDGKGQEVYYANPVTTEGGTLDLDSNAGCSIDNVNQETISWPQNKAPTGTYTVKVAGSIPATSPAFRIDSGDDGATTLALEYRVSNKISFVAQYEQRSLSNVTGNRDNFSFEVRFRRRF